MLSQTKQLTAVPMQLLSSVQPSVWEQVAATASHGPADPSQYGIPEPGPVLWHHPEELHTVCVGQSEFLVHVSPHSSESVQALPAPNCD
jgi:hypothetical protein